MQQDQIQYSVHPVFSYQDVYDKNLSNESDQLWSVIMIDCGGMIDWTQQDIINKGVNLYIFDSHHPIHHNNVHATRGITVIDDGAMPQLDHIPDDDDMNADAAEAEEAHDPDEEYQLEALANEPQEANEDDMQKRPRPSDDLHDESWKKTRADIVNEYYATHSTGCSMAGVMYDLAN